MMTAKIEYVIGLWLDGEGGDEPKWIVSRDRWEDSEPRWSDTLAMFGEYCYREARARAVKLATQHGWRVIKTSRSGERSCLFNPSED